MTLKPPQGKKCCMLCKPWKEEPCHTKDCRFCHQTPQPLQTVLEEQEREFEQTFHTLDGATIGVRAENYSTEHTWDTLKSFLHSSNRTIIQAVCGMIEGMKKEKIVSMGDSHEDDYNQALSGLQSALLDSLK